MSSNKVESQKIKNAMKSTPIDPKYKSQVWLTWKNDNFESAMKLIQELHEKHLNDNIGLLPQDSFDYKIYGKELIHQNAIDQMDVATTLPIARAAALMPDAHLGYGLPIGGVLATENAIIPNAVGVDIACRMRLSVFDIPFDTLEDAHNHIDEHHENLSLLILNNTHFGMGYPNRVVHPEHEVLDDKDWNVSKVVSSLKDKACKQIGTSGGGNHFVEWGIIERRDDYLPHKFYLSLLSHSGSRGFGFGVANHYHSLAKKIRSGLDESLMDLAWLDMDSDEGQEYWLAMNLAGRYAAANHEIIHESIANDGEIPLMYTIENHHNFAWKEQVDGEEMIVHRKGATPAGYGVAGIIPASMASAGMIVTGLGEQQSLNSASHGAGRVMGRREAKRNVTVEERDAALLKHNVRLLGGGIDEAPQAYKDIAEVYAAQANLVKVNAWFIPKIVRMAND